MQSKKYLKKVTWIAICTIVLLSLINTSGIGAESEGQTETLVVDAIARHGKVYQVKISADDISKSDSFSNTQIQRVIVNSKGKAVYFYYSTAEQSGVGYVNVLSGAADRATLDLPKLPLDLKGDLSPDGSKLCFLRQEGLTHIIEVLDISSGNLEEVIAVEGLKSPPSWSPDGISIAYYLGNKKSWRDDSFCVGISQFTKEGWEHRVVAPPSKPAMRSPARRRAPLWGSNGKVIVFRARYKDDEQGSSIYMVGTDGTGLVRITDTYCEPSSSSGSEGILYALPKEGIFLFDVNAKKTTKLSDKKGVFCPKLSPNGKFIAYSDIKGVVHVVSPKGLNPRKILDVGNELITRDFYWVSQ